MSANKRPSTSSLRRFITSRPYVTVAEIRRRFGLDDPDAMAHLQRNGTFAWIGLPDREATKLEELWHRDELGFEMSVEVRAPVVVGIYPLRIARYVIDGAAANGSAPTNGHAQPGGPRPHLNGNGATVPAPIADTGYASPAAPEATTHSSESGSALRMVRPPAE